MIWTMNTRDVIATLAIPVVITDKLTVKPARYFGENRQRQVAAWTY